MLEINLKEALCMQNVPYLYEAIFYLIWKMNPVFFKNWEPVDAALKAEFLGNQPCDRQPCKLNCNYGLCLFSKEN